MNFNANNVLRTLQELEDCNHTKSMHEGVRYKCDPCNKDFSGLSNLKRHKHSFHQRKTHQCKKCNKEYKSKQSMKTHINSFHEGIRVECDKCEKTFSCKEYLKEHMKWHDLKHQSLTYQCKECKACYTKRQSLVRHFQRNHKDKVLETPIILDETNQLSNEEKSKKQEVKEEPNHIKTITKPANSSKPRKGKWIVILKKLDP